MRPSVTRDKIDIYNQDKVHVWQAAALDLAGSTEATNPFVQTSLHAVLAWLRIEATQPRVLLELFGRPDGPLSAQLRLIGSLLGQPNEAPCKKEARRCWTIAKAAYYARWLEVASAPGTRRCAGRL